MSTRLEQARKDANVAQAGDDEVIVRKDTLVALMGLVPLIEGALKWKDPAPKPKASKFEVPAGYLLVPASKVPKDQKDPTATQLPAETGDPKPLDPIRGNFEVLLRALNADPTYETGAPHDDFRSGADAAEGEGEAEVEGEGESEVPAEGEGEGTTHRKRRRS